MYLYTKTECMYYSIGIYNLNNASLHVKVIPNDIITARKHKYICNMYEIQSQKQRRSESFLE